MSDTSLLDAGRRLAGLARSLRNEQEFDDDIYLQANPDVAAAVQAGVALSGRDHWYRHGWKEGRAGAPLEAVPDRTETITSLNRRPFGVNLFGFLEANSGLGEVARCCQRALTAAGVPLAAVNVAPWTGVSERRTASETPYRVNLIIQNADMMARFAASYGTTLLDGRYNIAFWFWELPSIRSAWFGAYRYADEIWVASEFCRHSIQCMTNLPVIRVPLVIDGLEQHANCSREQLGIPGDKFVFCQVFDVSSQFERKNPLATIQAFRSEFGDSDDVLLLIKYTNAAFDSAAVQRLRSAVAGARNIVLNDRVLSHHENISLHRVIDCLVSPHRSEGFGLNLAETMYFSKPVIATRYSSNIDFMTDENAYLIDYALTPIAENRGPYLRGAVWADAQLDHLARLMRCVFNNREERERKGRVAADTIRQSFSLTQAAQAIRSRLHDLTLDRDTVDLSGMRVHCGEPAHFNPGTPVDVQAAIRRMPRKPTVSVIVPVYNVDPDLLRLCIESVRRQWYPFWELCLCNDASTSAATVEALLRYRGTDARIKIVESNRNQGIAAASNRAVEISTGDYIALLDNDDELAPEAFFRVVEAVNNHPGADFFYTDEDKIEPDGTHSEPYFKPDWSPEHLRSVMYILHMIVLSKELFYSVGGFRSEYSGAQDYDLALRATAKSRGVIHVPHVLYHWRKIQGSTAAVVAAKPAALDAARRAAEDHARTIDREAWVEPGMLTGLFRTRVPIHGEPLVSVCIPTNDASCDVEGRGTIHLLQTLLRSIAEKTEYRNYEIVVCDNGNLSRHTRTALRDIPYRLCSYKGPLRPFNFAQKANFLMRNARGEHLILLNDDMEVIAPGWLTALIELSQCSDIGVVGGRLLFPNDRIQHVGVILGVLGGAAHVYHNYPAATIGYNGFTHLIRNYSAVTGACMATRRDVWHRLDGFDPRFAIDYNDIDYCLRAIEAGYRVVYTPYAELYHFEGKTERRSSASTETEALFRERWARYLDQDPYYNPNLSRTAIDFSPREDRISVAIAS